MIVDNRSFAFGFIIVVSFILPSHVVAQCSTPIECYAESLEKLEKSTAALVVQQSNIDELMEELRLLRAEFSILNSKLEEIQNPWIKTSDTISAIMPKSNAERDDFIELWIENEYAIVRNGTFLKLRLSEWNKGWRVSTEMYMTGDTDSPLNAKNQPDAPAFRIGGSMWHRYTRDPDWKTECLEGNQIAQDGGIMPRHEYYMSSSDGMRTINSSNFCRDEGPIYKRKRHLKK